MAGQDNTHQILTQNGVEQVNSQDYGKKLQNVTEIVSQIKVQVDSSTDGKVDAVNEAKIATVNNEMNEQFKNYFQEILKTPNSQDAQKVESLKKTLDELVKKMEAKNPDWKNDEKMKWLVVLMNTLNVSVNANVTAPEQVNESPDIKLSLTGSLDGVVKLGENEKTQWRFYSNLVLQKIAEQTEQKVQDAQEVTASQTVATQGASWVEVSQQVEIQTATQQQAPKENLEVSKLTLAVENLIKQNNDAKSFLEKDKDNAELQRASTLLDNMKIVIDNPNQSNVQILQKFIYDNMTDNEQKVNFINSNKNRQKYRKLRITSQNISKFGWENADFDGRFWKSTLSGMEEILTKTSAYLSEVKKAQDAQKSTVTIQNQTTNTINVQNNTGTNAPTTNPDVQQQPLDTTPLQINGQSYPVLPNSAQLAAQNHLGGATFYSMSNAPMWMPMMQNWMPYLTDNLMTKVEQKYYVKLNSIPGMLYRVSVDASWNICPIVEEVDTNLGDRIWWAVERKSVIPDNVSCANYLWSKIKGQVINDFWIAWDKSKKDYVLNSYGQSLTIEPMTIDWNWVSSDVSTCLKFLNLTNYLRWNGVGNTKWLDPDLKWDNGQVLVRVNKKNLLNSNGDRLKKRWTPLNLANFWLNNVSRDVWKKYIKYNNHEDWEDNWDKKKENRIYKKLDIPNVAPTVVPTGPIQQVSVDNSAVVTTGVDAQAWQIQQINNQPIQSQQIQQVDNQSNTPPVQPVAPVQPAAPTQPNTPSVTVTNDTQVNTWNTNVTTSTQVEVNPPKPKSEKPVAPAAPKPAPKLEVENPDPENVTQYGLFWNNKSIDYGWRKNLGIPKSTVAVYTEGKKASSNLYFYIDKSTNKLYGIAPGDDPYFKTEVIKDWLIPWQDVVNVCEAWAKKLNTLLGKNRNVWLSSIKIEWGKYIWIPPVSGPWFVSLVRSVELDPVKINKIIHNENIFATTPSVNRNTPTNTPRSTSTNTSGNWDYLNANSSMSDWMNAGQ